VHRRKVYHSVENINSSMSSGSPEARLHRISKRSNLFEMLQLRQIYHRPYLLNSKRTRALEFPCGIFPLWVFQTEFAQVFCFAPGPASMVPRTDNNKILVIRIFFLQHLIGLLRTIKIFLIPPSRYVQIGNRRRTQTIRNGLLLPKRIVVGCFTKSFQLGSLP